MAQILSDTPGRLHVRVRSERRSKPFMQTVEAHIAGRDGITQVRTNAGTGSVTVEYDRARQKAADVLAMLHDVGIVAQGVVGGDLPSAAEALPDSGTSTTADGIVGLMDDLDRRLSALTGRTIDLKLVFPLGLGAAGVFKLLQNGFEFEQVPAYVLLWYAFDSFYKLHSIATRGTAPADAASVEGRAATRDV